jgi:hypothetical protein
VSFPTARAARVAGQLLDGAPRRPLLAGLTALTGAAVLVDLRTDGEGWPFAAVAPAIDPTWRTVESELLLAAVACLAVAVLRVTGRPRSRGATAVVAGVVAVATGLTVLSLWSELSGRAPWWGEPEPSAVIVATLPFVAATVLGAGVAAVAATARMGAIAVGLAAVPLLALSTVPMVAGADVLYRRSSDAEALTAFLEPGVRFEATLTSPGRSGLGHERAAAVVVTGGRADGGPAGLYDDGAGSASGDFWSAEVDWESAVPAFLLALYLLSVLSVTAAATGPGPTSRPDKRISVPPPPRAA